MAWNEQPVREQNVHETVWELIRHIFEKTQNYRRWYIHIIENLFTEAMSLARACNNMSYKHRRPKTEC